MGFTNQITTGVWIGNDDNSPMRNVTGGLLPADTWKAFMLAAHKGKSVEPLAAPDPLIDDEMAQQITAYYEGLALAMTQERDLAAGVGGASAGR
jgi:penicillin-binding protein 1A